MGAHARHNLNYSCRTNPPHPAASQKPSHHLDTIAGGAISQPANQPAMSGFAQRDPSGSRLEYLPYLSSPLLASPPPPSVQWPFASRAHPVLSHKCSLPATAIGRGNSLRAECCLGTAVSHPAYLHEVGQCQRRYEEGIVVSVDDRGLLPAPISYHIAPRPL